jgi:hypothetical protein
MGGGVEGNGNASFHSVCIVANEYILVKPGWDKAGADESVHLAADYVKEHLSKFITQKPEIIEGAIKAHD